MYVNVSAIIIHKDKALIIQRSLDDKYFPGFWGVPGGGMEKQDSGIEDAAKREVNEELGIDVSITGLVRSNYNPESDVLFIKLSAKLDNEEDSTNKLTVSDELSDYKWVTVAELDEYEFTPHTKTEIQDALIDENQ